LLRIRANFQALPIYTLPLTMAPKWKDWEDTARGPFPSSLLVHRFSWRRIVRPTGTASK